MIEMILGDLPRPVARIVHIGAGTGDDLPACLASGAERILLLEADPDIAAQLAAQTAREPRVEVVAATVSADPRPRPFHRTNFPELDSLRAPAAALKELFPGLKILSRDQVTPADPVALLGKAPAGEGCQVLVLEMPGEALGILQALQKAGLLSGFDALCLREGRQALYEGAPAAGEIRDWLGAAGFVPWFEPRPEDPERPVLIARLDRKALDDRREIARLTAELEEARAQGAALVTGRDTARAEAEKLRAAQEAAEAKCTKLTDQVGTLTQERDAARSQLAVCTEALEKERAEAAKLREAHDTVEARRVKLSEEIKTVMEERDAARTGAEKLGEAQEAARKAETARDQAEQRMRQSRDEMLKAEGQIRLLRDLLLNGTEL